MTATRRALLSRPVVVGVLERIGGYMRLQWRRTTANGRRMIHCRIHFVLSVFAPKNNVMIAINVMLPLSECINLCAQVMGAFAFGFGFDGIDDRPPPSTHSERSAKNSNY